MKRLYDINTVFILDKDFESIHYAHKGSKLYYQASGHVYDHVVSHLFATHPETYDILNDDDRFENEKETLLENPDIIINDDEIEQYIFNFGE